MAQSLTPREVFFAAGIISDCSENLILCADLLAHERLTAIATELNDIVTDLIHNGIAHSKAPN
jgi:hypothetical protein